MYNYLLKFHATGNVEWLQHETFDAAFQYVESRYGSSWRNLCSIYACQKIDA